MLFHLHAVPAHFDIFFFLGGRFERCNKGVDRRFCIHNHQAPAGHFDCHVWNQSLPIVVGVHILKLHIRILRHSGKLHAIFQLHFAPTTTDMGFFKSVFKGACFARKGHTSLHHALEFIFDECIGFLPLDFQLLRLPLHQLQRFLQRRDSVLDGDLPLFQLSTSAFVLFAQGLLGEF